MLQQMCSAGVQPSCFPFVQVTILYALQKGFLGNSKPEDSQKELAEALAILCCMHTTAWANMTELPCC